ncbi:YadA-like family protein [Neisseria weaveri]|uniref:Adhesin n=1 Tax=Neisseria weaveri TaxID=28091 RepID=A0A3S5B6C3_9NEIS|nr:YadA-like family protein [Neisseria weaveri]VEJ52154.1 adhesin [Neisseria weaveri]
MNKSYRTIWNESLGAWVAVSEIEKTKGKPSKGSVGSSINNVSLSLWGTGLRTMIVCLGMAFGGVYQAQAATLYCETDSSGSPSGNIKCGAGSAANGNQSIAIGSKAKATGVQSVSIGADTIASGSSSVAIGGDDLLIVSKARGNNTANTSNIALKYRAVTGDVLFQRYDSTQSGEAAVAVGVSAKAADLATAFGTRSNAAGAVSVALGAGAHADKENAVAIGAGASTVNTTAEGITDVALNSNKVAITTPSTEAPAFYRLRINNVDFDFKAGNSVSDGDIVSFGAQGFERQLKYVAPGKISENSTDAVNGSQLYTVVDALTALRGNVTNLENTKTRFYSVNNAGTTAATGNYDNDGAKKPRSLAAGVEALANGDGAVSVGYRTKSTAGSAVAVGDRAEALDNQAIAIGQEAKASADWDISIGRRAGYGIQNVAEEGRNIAIGDGALKQADAPNNNIALGTDAAASSRGNFNVAIGTYANAPTSLDAIDGIAVKTRVQADRTVAVGDRAVAYTSSSVGVGARSKAIGTISTAVGASAEARGDYSIAHGYSAKATGTSSIAIGGAQNVGTNSTQATAHYAVAVGSVGTQATGVSSLALGHGAQASGANAIAQGKSARAGAENNIAVGNNAQASTGTNTIAIGKDASVSAANAVVVGHRATVAATGAGSVAVGSSSKANGVNATAVGQASEAAGQNSFAGGQDSHATGKSTVAVGDGAKSTQDSAVAVGAYAHAGPEAADLAQDQNAGAGSAAFGYSARAVTYRSLALGAASKAAGGNGALAIGDTAQALAGDTVAIGTSSSAAAVQAVALGRQSNAAGAKSLALGYLANTGANADSATAIGREARADLANAVALGSGSVANTAHGVAGADPLGAETNKANSTWTATTAAVAVGKGSEITRQITSVAAGAADTDAVNVAQLKAAGFKLIATASEGTLESAAETKVKNGETVTLDAGKNIKLTQNGKTIKVATKDEVEFNRVTVGDVQIDSQGINAGNKVISNVAAPTAANHAANKAYVDSGRTQVKSSNKTVTVVSKTENGANVYDLSVDTSLLAQADGTNIALQYGGDGGTTGSSALSQRVQFNGTSDEIVTTATDGNVTFKLADAVKNKIEAAKNQAEANKTKLADHETRITDNQTAAKAAADKAAENAGKIDQNTLDIQRNADKIAEGLNFSGNNGTPFKRELGQTVAVKGADTNISTTADNGTITVELAKTLDLGATGSVTTGKTKLSDNGVTITPTGAGNPVSLTSDGLDNGNKTIRNVADAQNETDAVNKRQLDEVANSGWNLHNNGQAKDTVKRNDVVNFADGEGTTALVETAGDTSSTVKFSVNTAALNVRDGVVSADKTGNAFATATDVAQAINASEKTSSVVQGNNTRVTTDVQGNHTAYTIHAEKTTLTGSDKVSVTAGNKDNNDVTNYAVDLTDAAKQDIEKGVQAKTAIDGSGLQLKDGAGAFSSVKKLGESFTVTGDSNITTAANTDGIEVKLNPNLSVTSVNAGGSTLNSDGLTITGGPSVTKAGIDSANQKLTNLAAGQDDGDAVNMSQLKDSDNIAKGNMAALGGKYDSANNTYTQPSYALKDSEGAVKTPVHTVQDALSSLNEEIEKPLTFVADKGTNSSRKLGSTVSIKAGNFAGAASVENLVTENDGNGTITIKLADNPTFKGKVTAQGLDAGGQQITGVAKGNKETDAVNVGQLQQAMKDVTVENLALVAADSPFSYINGAGEQLIRKVNEQGQPYFLKADGITPYKGTDISISALNPTDPQTSVATRVTNVSKGIKDTDAVNTAQLKDVLTALGTTLGTDGVPVKPVYEITRADGSPIGTVNTVQEALGHLNTALKDPITISGNANKGSSTIVQGGSDHKLGSKLQIVGGLASDEASADNIRTVVSDGKVEIQLANAPTFTGKLSAKGLDAGNAKITGVANGSDPTDAVNKSQLDAVSDRVNLGWGLTASGANLSKVTPDETVDLNNTDNNIVISKTANSNDVTFNLAKDLNVDSVTAGDSVLSSDGLKIKNGPSVTKAGIDAADKAVSNVAAGKNDKDAVNVSQLAPLAKALGVTVDRTSGAVSAPAFTVMKTDGTQYDPVNSIQGAFDHIGSEIRKPITFAGDNGSGNFDRNLGSTVNLKGGADATKLSDRNIGVISNGQDTLDIKLAKELTELTSAEFTDAQGNRTTVDGNGVTVRNADGQNTVKLNSDGLRIENGPSLTKTGLDAANTVIRNVAGGNVGENSNDAVNGSQLHAHGKGVQNVLGGSTTYNPADGSYANNNIGGTGKSNIHEAIESVRNTAGAGWNLTAEGVNSSNVAAGETVDLTSTDKNIVIAKQADNDQVAFDLADDIKVDSVTAGDTVVNDDGVTVNSKNGKAPVVLNSDGLNNGGNAVTNIAAGKSNTDAVNVSQLKPLASALGMAFDAASGNISAPAITVMRTDGTDYPTVSTIQDAFNHVGTEMRKAIRFDGNTGMSERKLGETLVIKGSLADNAQASDQNIRTKVANNTMTIELAETPKFGKVTVNDNGKITGIESGEVADGSKEAVNGNQLYDQGKGVETLIGGTTVYNPATGTYTNTDIGGTGAANINDAIAAVKDKATAGWNLTAQGKDSSNVQPGDTVDLRGADQNIVITKSANSDTVTFDLADDITVNSVKSGKTTVNQNGVQVDDSVALTEEGLKAGNVAVTTNGINAGDKVISNLAKGLVAQGSKEAVTGDQLFAVQEQLNANIGVVEKGLNFTGNSGNFNRKLGENVTVKGGLANTVAASSDNVRTVADSSGNIDILLADAPTFKGKLTAHGLDAGGQRVNNVQKGQDDNDAVNVEQLREAMINASVTTQTVVNANAPFSYVNANGDILVRSVEKDGTVKFKKASDSSEYEGEDISIAALNAKDPQSAIPTVLGNIADGKKANDAVNVGQLKNTVKALGGGAAINSDGTIKDPVFTVTGTNGAISTLNNVSDALNALNTEVLKPLTFTGDNVSEKVNRQLGEELTIKGGATGTLTDNNIGVTGSAADNTLLVKLAETVNLGENGSVTTGKTVLNNDGVKVGSDVALNSDGLKAGNVNITASGIDAGGKQITGVKAGEKATDAVNKAQLDAVKAAASNKVEAQGNLTVKEETNTDGSTTYTLATADDVNFNSVTAGKGANEVLLDGKGVSVGGNTYLTAQGINANGKKVANVAKGSVTVDSTDAVNGSQLYNTAASVANLFGGDAAVNTDGSLRMTNIGGTGANNIDDAIKAVNQAVAVSKVAVVQGDNIVVDKAANPDGSTTYTVSTAKDLKVDSISVGSNTTLNGNGISIANGPSLTDTGLNAAGKKLSNVADGEISATSKDAVNGSQLYQAYQVLGGNSTSINMTDAPATSNSDGSSTPAGTVTTVVTNPDGTQTTTVETNQKVAVSADKSGKQYTLTTYNVEGQNTYVTNDVIMAVGKMNEQGIKFFHTNDGEVKPVVQGNNNEDSSASGAYATAIGFQSSASGQGAVALGNTYQTEKKVEGAQLKEVVGADGKVSYEQRTMASGIRSIAMGTGSQALAEDTIAIGTGNVVRGKHSGAIGDPSIIDGANSYSVGNNNTVATDDTFVLGNNVTKTIKNSVVLGSSSSATAVHTTAAGGHYTYAGANDANVAGVNDVVGVVSVGMEGQTRQIQNVAAGVVSPTSTDAINGSQLYHTNEAVNKVVNHLGNIHARIDDVENRGNAGTATAMAVAGLPQAYLPGKSMVAVAGGTYRGESGYAIGYSSISDGGNWVVKGSATGNSRGHYGATAGVGYQW